MSDCVRLHCLQISRHCLRHSAINHELASQHSSLNHFAKPLTKQENCVRKFTISILAVFVFGLWPRVCVTVQGCSKPLTKNPIQYPSDWSNETGVKLFIGFHRVSSRGLTSLEKGRSDEVKTQIKHNYYCQ